MRIYGLPNALPAPVLERYSTEDLDAHYAAEAAHRERLKQWLREHGYTGERTGEIVRFPVADGFAQYMLADGVRTECLIHLPYGDGWQYRDAKFLPKAEILRRIDAQKRVDALFDGKLTGD